MASSCRILLLLWNACQSSARTNLPANLETVCNWIGESDNVIMVGEQTRILSQCCEINERLLAFDESGNKSMQPYLYFGGKMNAASLETEYIY